MTSTDRDQVAAIARAFDMNPADLRSDSPTSVIGWTGTATDWLLAADHLGVILSTDPPESIEVATIGDVVAIVTSSGHVRAIDKT